MHAISCIPVWLLVALDMHGEIPLCLTLKVLLFACLLHGNINNDLLQAWCYNLLVHVDTKICVCFFLVNHYFTSYWYKRSCCKIEWAIEKPHADMRGLSVAFIRRIRVSSV